MKILHKLFFREESSQKPLFSVLALDYLPTGTDCPTNRCYPPPRYRTRHFKKIPVAGEPLVLVKATVVLVEIFEKGEILPHVLLNIFLNFN